jgi:hypothetical protein
VAGDYARIPPLVWQAERLAQKGLPWQLHVHAAQAQLALGAVDEARKQLAKARTAEHVPPQIEAMLDDLARECDEAAQQAGVNAPSDLP